MITIDDYRRELIYCNLNIGSFYRIDHPTLNVSGTELASPTIYGEVLERTGGDEFVVVKAYSQACPDGERGHMSMFRITALLTRDEFNTAREAGWPRCGNMNDIRG